MRTISQTIRHFFPAIMISSVIAAEPAKPDESLLRALRETEMPSVNFADITLGEACDFMKTRLRDLSKEHREYPVEIKDGKVSIRKITGLAVEGLPFGVVLAYAVEMAGAGMVLDGDTIRITGKPDVGGMKAADFANKEAATLPDLSKIVIPSLKLDADGDFAFHLFAVKMESEKASQAKKPVNIVSMVDAKVGEKTNGREFKNKTAREVLDEMAKATGTRVVFAAHAVEFRPAGKAEGAK